MTDADAWQALGARPARWAGNEPVALGGAYSLRLVEEGSVAVFSAAVRDGAPTSRRRFLCRIGSGQAVVSSPGLEEDGLTLVVVPVGEAVVRAVELDGELDDPRRLPDGTRLVEEWVRLLARLVTGFGEPDLPLRLEPGVATELEDGQVVRARREGVAWVAVEEGELRLLGGREARVGPGAGPFPLADPLWAEAYGPARVTAGVTAEVDGAALRDGLGWLQGRVLAHLRARQERERQADHFRHGELARLQRLRTGEALEDLAGVVRSRPERVREGPHLLMAMQAIGRSFGCEVEAPSEASSGAEHANPVETIARRSHLRLRRVTLKREWWRWDCGALLGFSFEDGTPVALLRDVRGRYEIVNPAEGTRTRVDAGTADWLAPEAVMVYRPFPEGRAGPDGRGGGLGLRDLVRFSLGRRLGDLWRVLWMGTVATLLGMLTPQAMAILLDHAVPDANERLLLELGLGLLAATLGIVVFRVAQGIVLIRIGVGSEAESQAALWDRVLRLRPSFFRRFSSGDLQSRVMTVNQIGREFSGTTLSTLFASLLATLNLGLLFYYSPRLALLAVAVGALVMVLTVSVGFLVHRNLRALMELEGDFFGMVVQLLDAVGKLRVAGAGERAYTHWLRRYADKLRYEARIDRLQEPILVFNEVLPVLTSAGVFLVAHGMLQADAGGGSSLTLGTFMAFNVALGSFLAGIAGISDAAVDFLDISAKGERIEPLLREPPEVDPDKADPGSLSGRIELRGVDFAYAEDGPKVLDSVDLSVEPGELVAVVGPSGSGKSTLLRLLLGFERPAAGTVSYDGQDLANLDLFAVRRQLGVVLQGGRLDADSIFENIACGRALTLDEAWEAAEDAGCAEEIRAMPMGMHTVLSVGGSNLSGGQRQRILIARALSHRPRILFFDEATSALDNRTQAIVSESLERLNVTRIVVAHRLSTIRNADRIYVLEKGRVVQAGRFRELMGDEAGLFARMMARQLA